MISFIERKSELNGLMHLFSPCRQQGKFGYASLYGDLPDYSLERKQAPSITSVPSERYWEMLFSGPSHSLPPLTKLCSTFLESLLQRRSAVELERLPVLSA